MARLAFFGTPAFAVPSLEALLNTSVDRIGTWHCVHRSRSGCDVRISSRAPGPVWHALQFSRMSTMCGIVGGEFAAIRAPGCRSCLSPTQSVATKRPSSNIWTWHCRHRPVAPSARVSSWGDAGAKPTFVTGMP